MTLAHNHLLIFHDIIINFMRNVLYMGEVNYHLRVAISVSHLTPLLLVRLFTDSQLSRRRQSPPLLAYTFFPSLLLAPPLCHTR